MWTLCDLIHRQLFPALAFPTRFSRLICFAAVVIVFVDDESDFEMFKEFVDGRERGGALMTGDQKGPNVHPAPTYLHIPITNT